MDALYGSVWFDVLRLIHCQALFWIGMGLFVDFFVDSPNGTVLSPFPNL